MYALVEMWYTDSFRRKHLNISFTAMALAIAVKEVFAGLPKAYKAFFSKSDRSSFLTSVIIDKTAGEDDSALVVGQSGKR